MSKVMVSKDKLEEISIKLNYLRGKFSQFAAFPTMDNRNNFCDGLEVLQELVYEVMNPSSDWDENDDGIGVVHINQAALRRK